MFPTINHINDLLPYIQGNPQFRVDQQDNGMTIVCYMLQDEDTFSGDNEEWKKECRGITFHPDGTVAARTLHKFQNVGENDSTLPHLIPWDKITRIMDKRDGSMITPVIMPDGTIKCKTKKTFTSAEAIEATEFIHQIVVDEHGNKDQPYLEWIRSMLNLGLTPTFEWTSPRFPIVLTYEKDELTLLQIRNNVTGCYANAAALRYYADTIPFPVVENLRSKFNDPRELLELAKTTTGVEGWIIQTDEGEMWKIKTKWYCDLHHSVTFTRWRDVARIVIADQSDDLKAAFTMTGRSIDPILQVERRINRELAIVQDAVENHVANGRCLNRTAKDMALALKNHELFGLIMRLYRGQEVNYREWYEKNKLDEQWSIEVIPVTQQQTEQQ